MGLILFPFSIISLFALTTLTVSGLRNNLNIKFNQCITEVTSIQRHHKNITNKLFSLNPKAKALRIKRKIVEASYRAAPPPAKPPLYAALQAVKVSQKILRATQLSLIKAAEIEQLRFNSTVFVKGYKFSRQSKSLKLVSYPKKSDSPSYKLQKNYSKRKSIKIYRHFDTTKNFTPILSKLVKNKRGVIKCGATIQKRKDQKLKVRLIEDK